MSLARRMLRIASACLSESLKRRCSSALAVSVSADPRMTLMTASMLSTAILSPSRMCSRSLALSRSNCVRRTITSWRCAMKCSSTSRSPMTLGTRRFVTGSGTSASMITPNVLCIVECLYSWLSTTRGMASRFSSITTRMPSRSDSSRRSEIPSSFLSRTSSAICSTSRALLTWYGSSVTTICDLLPFSFSSMAARARMTILPRPVSM